MSDLVAFIIGSFITWRITSFVWKEEGPWSIFSKFRDRIGIKYDINSNKTPTTELAKMVGCFWCLSVWVALLCSFFDSRGFSIGNALAWSACAIFMNTFLYKAMNGKG